MSHSFYTINPVRTPEDLQIASTLFRAYAVSLGIDLSFQNFEAEMASMPGKYAAPAGEILLARDSRNSNALGCVAMRPLSSPGCCEMKRLYVQPEGRALGLGNALVQAVLSLAKERGYEEVKLDTLGSMSAALRLYKRVGFRVTQAYYDTPIEGTVFLARYLSDNTP